MTHLGQSVTKALFQAHFSTPPIAFVHELAKVPPITLL